MHNDNVMILKYNKYLIYAVSAKQVDIASSRVIEPVFISVIIE